MAEGGVLRKRFGNLQHFAELPANSQAKFFQFDPLCFFEVSILAGTTKPMKCFLQLSIGIRKLGQKVSGIPALGPLRGRSLISQATGVCVPVIA
jgi:hypothetical protein